METINLKDIINITNSSDSCITFNSLDTNKYLTEYLYYFLKFHKYVVEKQNTEILIKRITEHHLKYILVPIKPIEAQRIIIIIVENYDNSIQSIRCSLKSLKQENIFYNKYSKIKFDASKRIKKSRDKIENYIQLGQETLKNYV